MDCSGCRLEAGWLGLHYLSSTQRSAALRTRPHRIGPKAGVKGCRVALGAEGRAGTKESRSGRSCTSFCRTGWELRTASLRLPLLWVPSPPAPRALIGWRAGSLARACGCSYKNPRVPALSSSKRVPALPSASQRQAEPAAARTPGRPRGGDPAAASPSPTPTPRGRGCGTYRTATAHSQSVTPSSPSVPSGP